MELSKTELSELISTRISHDLIGNIGAIANVLEMVEDNNGQLDEDIKKVLYTGTNTLMARQSFFRLTFGKDNKQVPLGELQALCDKYLKTIGNHVSPIELKFQHIVPELTKIACVCVMIAGDLFLKGGQITICVNKDNMCVTAETDYKFCASKVNDYQHIFSGKNTECDSQYAELYYLQELLGAEVPLKFSADEKSMELIIG